MAPASPSPSEEPTVVLPDPRHRLRVLLGVLGTLLVGGVLVYGLHRFGIAQDPEVGDGRQLIRNFQGLIYASTILALGVGFWLIHLAQGIFRAQRFPLPGQKVLVPTPVRTGWAARRLAVSLGLFGVALTVLAGATVYLSAVLLQRIQLP
ncbi:MAG: hypothetical protein ACFCBW_16810 [Candidatus Competibacterales bacterium]